VPDLQPGDLVLTLGAGDVTTVGPQVLALLDPTGLGGSQ
jgi:UDP-N-acetylmuramate--alanine ligase